MSLLRVGALVGGRQKARTKLTVSSARHLDVERDTPKHEGAFVESVGFVVIAVIEKLTTFGLVERVQRHG